MKIQLDEGATMPTRAHEFDAGCGLYAREGQVVPANGSAIFDTGVHVEIPEGYVGFLKSKSGLNLEVMGIGTLEFVERDGRVWAK